MQYGPYLTFDGNVMEGFFTCLKRMVPNPTNHYTIKREMKMYKNNNGLFDFHMVVQERKTRQISNLTSNYRFQWFILFYLFISFLFATG